MLYRPLFKHHGKNLKIFPNSSFFSYSKIETGDDVYIGPGAHFSSICSIKIGNKVLFGPNVTIITGDHRFELVGQYMYDIKEKREIDDLPVIINEDVWVGANVIILKGVIVGRGSIIAAGSLVNKDILPYTINVGFPSKPLRCRFNIDEIIEHESILYNINERYSRDELEAIFSKLNPS